MQSRAEKEEEKRRSLKADKVEATIRKNGNGSEIVKIRSRTEEKISSFFLFYISRTIQCQEATLLEKTSVRFY
ncbi:hypothetical protein Taro_027169 [Colocasia esculenta]|uniref:Uncharacterized protein n=1 Tax=Colocasia esculenta TaxID=4460 RepID=A0A843VEY8_COLES|nr:hypothetical protein [Colocasia esculenta]